MTIASMLFAVFMLVFWCLLAAMRLHARSHPLPPRKAYSFSDGKPCLAEKSSMNVSSSV
jgi:uncharacterized membrane protein YhaH (DUF805 family)